MAIRALPHRANGLAQTPRCPPGTGSVNVQPPTFSCSPANDAFHSLHTLTVRQGKRHVLYASALGTRGRAAVPCRITPPHRSPNVLAPKSANRRYHPLVNLVVVGRAWNPAQFLWSQDHGKPTQTDPMTEAGDTHPTRPWRSPCSPPV